MLKIFGFFNPALDVLCWSVVNHRGHRGRAEDNKEAQLLTANVNGNYPSKDVAERIIACANLSFEICVLCGSKDLRNTPSGFTSFYPTCG